MSSSNEFNINLSGLWEKIQTRLHDNGIEMEIPDDFNIFGDMGSVDSPRVKVVCVSPDLKESVEEMGRKQRDQVVMVRIDAETLQNLDAWVATKAVKSRSEAAALFIREGLKVRADELDKLRDALKEVHEAEERLKNKAREIFGQD